MKEIKNWNPVLNKFIEIKNEYMKRYETMSYDVIDGITCFERWVIELGIKEYFERSFMGTKTKGEVIRESNQSLAEFLAKYEILRGTTESPKKLIEQHLAWLNKEAYDA